MTVVVFSTTNFAQQNSTKKKTVDVKCHVELVGGGESINFWMSPANKLQKLARNIVGKEVMIPSANAKKVIYKVHECVLLTKKFKGATARQLDEMTPR